MSIDHHLLVAEHAIGAGVAVQVCGVDAQPDEVVLRIIDPEDSLIDPGDAVDVDLAERRAVDASRP
jgi:hypothetical protein